MRVSLTHSPPALSAFQPCHFAMNPILQPPIDEGSAPLAAAEFDARLVAILPRLRAYVAAILGGWVAADDIVQDVAMVLIQKRETFRADGNFDGWAFRVAYFKATTWRRDMQREGRVMFSETFFQEAAAIAEEHFTETPVLHDVLGSCLEKLSPDDRKLLHLKYVDRVSLTRHAESSGRKATALHKTISRIRLALRQCIGRQLDSTPTRL